MSESSRHNRHAGRRALLPVRGKKARSTAGPGGVRRIDQSQRPLSENEIQDSRFASSEVNSPFDTRTSYVGIFGLSPGFLVSPGSQRTLIRVFVDSFSPLCRYCFPLPLQFLRADRNSAPRPTIKKNPSTFHRTVWTRRSWRASRPQGFLPTPPANPGKVGSADMEFCQHPEAFVIMAAICGAIVCSLSSGRAEAMVREK